MIYLQMAFVFFLAGAAQWAWSAYFSFWGLTPQALLVLTVVAAARRGALAAMCFGFAWGLCLDVFRAHLFGSNALALTLIGYAVGSARRQIDVTSLASLSVVIVAITWGYFLLHGLLGLIFLKTFLWVGWSEFLLDPVYNCLVLPFLFWFWEGVMGL